MQLAARSYVAAGVALVGAGAIAISPVAPPAPHLKVPTVESAHVALSAAANPFDAYVQLLTNTFTNVQALVNTELADSAPILQQVVVNQISSGKEVLAGLQGAGTALVNVLDPANPYGLPAQLQLAFNDLIAGDVNGAFANAWSAFLAPVLNAGLPLLTPIMDVIKQPLQNLVNVVSNPLAILLPVLGVLGTAYGTFTVAGNIGQDVVDAVKAMDPLGLLSTLVSAPAVLANAFLNGPDNDSGIFGPSAGIIATLRLAREQIAAAITPQEEPANALKALASAPDPSAKKVILDVKTLQAPAAAPAPAGTDSADENGSGASGTGGAEQSSSGAAGAGAPVVQDSPKVTHSKTDRTAANPAKAVRDSVRDSVKKATGGLKKAGSGASSHHAKGAA